MNLDNSSGTLAINSQPVNNLIFAKEYAKALVKMLEMLREKSSYRSPYIKDIDALLDSIKVANENIRINNIARDPVPSEHVIDVFNRSMPGTRSLVGFSDQLQEAEDKMYGIGVWEQKPRSARPNEVIFYPKSQEVLDIQRKIGATPDGYWGPDTNYLWNKKLEKYYHLGADDALDYKLHSKNYFNFTTKQLLLKLKEFEKILAL
jgi:hypothetical protein